MAEVSSSGLTAYQWTDYDKKIKASENKEPQQTALKEALKDNKLTGSEVKDLKESYRQAFMKENPNESLDTADANFYEGLASVTGIDSNKIRSSDSSPVEFTFNIKNDSIASITQDNNEDGDSDVITTKKGGAEATVTSRSVQTPASLNFKDYKTNNFDKAYQIPENKDNFSKGNVSTIKEEKVVEAIGGQAETSPKDTIKSFQSSIGLTGKDIDGKFGPKTLSSLANKYTEALNTNPATDASRAELLRLGTAIDKLQPIFEGTDIGNDLKALRANVPPSDQVDATKKAITDKREIIKVASEFVNKGTQALKKNPADYEGFKKVSNDVKASNLPDSVKEKIMERLGKTAGDKLMSNIGSPPAQTLKGTELFDSLPDGNPNKEALKTMYSPKVENGQTTWTLKTPNQMAESLKSGNSEITKKVFASLGPKKSQVLAEKALSANIGKSPLKGTDFIDVLPDGNNTKEKFKAMYSPKVENGETIWALKTPTQIADDKLSANIGKSPLRGTDLINTLPDGNATKDAFKAMYTERKGNPTTWILKNPNQISESLKDKSSEVIKKVLSSLSPRDAQAVAEKSLSENIGEPSLRGTDFIDVLPDGNTIKEKFKAMYSSKVENGETIWALKT